MGRPERPLDPLAGPIERLAWELRQLREEAGRPSYRELARRAHFSRSTLAEAATGMRLPTLEATVAYAVACGGDRAEWEERWRAAAEEFERSNRRCPYPGLTPLRAGDADLFFGRAGLAENLVKAAEQAPLTVVLGASGSGKSSLLQAGLLAELGAGTLMTPGPQPSARLTEALDQRAGEGRFVVVIDQFEEAFTLCSDESERAGFLDELAGLADERTALVIGVRTDFYGRCAEHPGLVAALRDAVHLPIGPLTGDELREIIVGPASRVGLTVAPELVATVLAEAAGQPGALPLLAHALRETWRRQPGEVLGLADYEATGGVGGAIAQTAERLYEDLDRAQRELVRAVLLRLTALGEGTEDTRRRVERDELTGIGGAGDIDAVLDRLTGSRLVVMDGDRLEVAHEALIGAWPRLREWLNENREALHRHQRLTLAASEWDRHGRDREFLYRGGRLAAWDADGVSTGVSTLNELERAFLAAGRSVARRRVRLAFGGLSLVAAVVSVLAVLALVQAERSAGERDRAVSRQLAGEARRQLQLDPELALLLAIRAYESKATPEADLVLRQATLDSRLRRTLATGMSRVDGMTATPDGRRVAIWGSEEPLAAGLQVWSWDGTRLSRDSRAFPANPTNPANGIIMSAAFSPDGRRLVTGSDNGKVLLWDMAGSGPPTLLGDTKGEVPAVAFAPDGRVAAAHKSGVRIWTASRRQTWIPVPALNLLDVAFSPDGKRLATGGNGSPLRVWDVTRERPRVVRSAEQGTPRRVAFSPAGPWVAAFDGGTPQVWNLDEPIRGKWKPQAELRGHGSGLNGVAFSPAGDRLATYAMDGTIRVWTTGDDLGPLVLCTPGSDQVGAAFGPGGRSLLSVGRDRVLRLWDIASGGLDGATTLRGRPYNGLSRALSADAGTVATIPLDAGTGAVRDRLRPQTAQVWNLARGGTPITVRGPRVRSYAAALSPDGRWLAGIGTEAGVTGTLRLWDLTHGGGPRAELLVHRRGGKALVFSPDGRRIAVTGRGGGTDTLVFDHPGNGTLTPVKIPQSPGEAVQDGGLGFSPDGRRLATARDDRTVVILDLAGTAPPKVLRGHQEAVGDLAFGPAGRRVAAAAADGTIRLWDPAGQGQPAAVLRGSGGISRALAFSPDGAWLATGERDGTLRMWRAEGGTEPLVFGGQGAFVGPLAFHRDGERLTTALSSSAIGRAGTWPPTGLGDNVVRIWRCEVCGPGDRVLRLARARALRKLTAEERRIFLGSGA